MLHESPHDIAGSVYELARFACFLSLQTLHIESPGPRSWAFTVANGETGADIFSNKELFSNMVNNLGYHAPRSIRIEPKDMGEGADYHRQIIALDTQRLQRFCKPANAARGRGACMTETPEEAFAYVARQEESYLVQTFEKPEYDWRYILHRDSMQLAKDEQEGWRVAFKVARPTVLGDGVKAIGTLVAENEYMPESSKQAYTSTHKEALATIPREGELVELVQTGNRAQGAYRQPHSAVEERNLDRFMTHFINDIESSLGTTLGTVCFDLGVKDSAVLLQEYDFCRIKNSVVFYEHQLPFGMKPYLHEVLPPETAWGLIDKLIPISHRRQYVEARVYASFIMSVIRSGRFLRRRNKQRV